MTDRQTDNEPFLINFDLTQNHNALIEHYTTRGIPRNLSTTTSTFQLMQPTSSLPLSRSFRLHGSGADNQKRQRHSKNPNKQWTAVYPGVSSSCNLFGFPTSKMCTGSSVSDASFGPNVKILNSNSQIVELQTIIRDKYAFLWGYIGSFHSYFIIFSPEIRHEVTSNSTPTASLDS